MSLFYSLPLIHEEHLKYAKLFNGNYNHCTGCLIHITVMSRPEISYAIMRLSGYNVSYTPATFHHYLLIMYRCSNNEAKLQSYTVKGHTEILDPEKYQGLMVYTDVNFSRDLNSYQPI